MKALIINYNRLTLTRSLADWSYSHGLDPIIIDNNSDYEPLMDWYHDCQYMVMHMNKNYGHTVIWNPEASILERLKINDRYIVTDSDLDLSKVPDDFLDVLNDGLNYYRNVDKCGLSLEINDLPNSPEGNFIRIHEAKYWQKPLNDLYFDAATDTTFALYRKTAREYNHNAIRTNRPYTAKHVPWYYTDINLLPEDEQNYYRTANPVFASGKNRLLCGK